jgi:thymidylate synthase
MIYDQKHFGYSIYEKSIGKAWLDVIKAVMDNGDTTFDEGRKRLSLQSLRIKAEKQDVVGDLDIKNYGNKTNIDAVMALTFEQPKMVDIDVNPSFGPGAKSYYTRLQEGKMLEFVTKRLSTIPESKKAVIVFPTYEDYEAVLKNPWNDYLPCMVAVQFRMVPNGGSGRYKLNTIFFARSLDIFQKGLGNLVALSKMNEIVAKDISKETGRTITPGFIEGLITDVHLYEETFDDAKKLMSKVYKSEKPALKKVG